MGYRVYLDGSLLKNLPKGLDTFSKEFNRDNELFGIYIARSFDLIFVGDGYCILKDFQSDFISCSKEILIQQYCNNTWVDVFNGLIEVSTVEIDEELCQATCEIQDNSPLILLSRNSEVSVDMEANKDIFGNAITPASLSAISLSSPTVANIYSANYYDYSSVIKQIIQSITGVTCNITSSFLSLQPQPCVYELQYTGDLNDIISTTITFKNFQGNTQTIVADLLTGNQHLEEVSKRLLSSTLYIASTNNGNLNTIQFCDDYRNFYHTSINFVTKKITLYSNLPIEIISVEIDYFSLITVTATKVQDFSDGGGTPIFMNYRLLKGQSSPYRFTLSFKEVMELLNKEYNVYFLAKYNNSGEIDFILENHEYFYDTTPNFTFDNARNLKVKFNDTIASKQITLGDSSDTTLANKSITFTTESCNIGQSYDASSSFVIGSARIQQDLIASFSDRDINTKYILSCNGDHEIVDWSNGIYIFPVTPYSGYVYNIFLTNWHKVYRHLSKFRGNVIGQASYFDTDTDNYSIDILNTSTNRLFRDYTFTETITSSQFNLLVDDIVDRAKFKKKGDMFYREGLISNIKYNYNTGEAEITILGE